MKKLTYLLLLGLACLCGPSEPVVTEAQQRVQAGCCDTVKPVPCKEDECACPMYWWMDWGNYKSYYALIHEGCQPANHDGVDLTLATSCPCEPCYPTKRDGKERLKSDPREDGYNEPRKLGRKGSFNLPSGVEGTPLRPFVVRFKRQTGEVTYAEIFIAHLTPAGYPAAILGRGIEIAATKVPADPTSPTIMHDIDYPQAWGSGPFHTKNAREKAIIYTHRETSGLTLEVPIILHKDTSTR